MTEPTTTCFKLIRGRAMRVTKVDACGDPVAGARNQVSSKGFISVALTSNVDEGTTIDVPDANGDRCIYDAPSPKFRNYTVNIELCGVNPDLVSLVTGNELVLDADDNRVGFDIGSDVDVSEVAFALEVWSTVPGEQCVAGLKSYGYFLLPFVQGGQFGDFTIANDAVNFTLNGAQTKDGTGWGVGPYDVQLDDGGDPGPLVSAIGSNKHLRIISTQVPPPSVEDCGAGPVGAVATGATAGIPGEFTPTFSYPPADLAGMEDVVADPLTAWTTGQYVTLGDDSQASWDSTDWVAGPA